jgi:hypothetical protein
MRSKLNRPWYLMVFLDPGSVMVISLLLESDSFVKSIKHSFWVRQSITFLKGYILELKQHVKYNINITNYLYLLKLGSYLPTYAYTYIHIRTGIIGSILLATY